MVELGANWITEGRIDFEYKKYLLLAYLQQASKHFDEAKLYPVLADLVEHYNNLNVYKERKELVQNQFPKALTKADFKKFQLEYEQLLTDDEHLGEIERLVDLALPMLEQHVKLGSELYEFIADKMEISPVGILPLYKEEGYLMICYEDSREARVFEFASTLFESAKENYRGLRTTYVDTYQLSLGNSLENIKVDLVRKMKKFANPATYAIGTTMSFPFRESIFPIAKRMLLQQLSTAA